MNPSFVWHSIMASQNLLRSGARWKIGRGNQVRIFCDPWLPNELNPYMESPIRSGLEKTIMNSLKDMESND